MPLNAVMVMDIFTLKVFSQILTNNAQLTMQIEHSLVSLVNIGDLVMVVVPKSLFVVVG